MSILISRTKIFAALFALLAGDALADVIVVANRSGDQRQVKVIPADGPAVELEIVRGDLAAIPVSGRAYLKFSDERGEHRQLLDANTAYALVEGSSGLVLAEVPLGGSEASRGGLFRPSAREREKPGKIPVFLYMDEPDEALRGLWEQRLRKRVQAASFTIERHCRLQLEVVGAGDWSPAPENDFELSMRHFERVELPAGAMVAIGFTRRHAIAPGRVHMGGIRGPLATHILIREWEGRTRESDRVEVLVHELGHFLGAVHSPEEESVMRPLVGQPKGTSATYSIRFDAASALAMNLIAEDIRLRGALRLGQLNPATIERLGEIYTALDARWPAEKSAARGAKIMELVKQYQERSAERGKAE